jgi:hypothetical protein
MLPFLFLRNKTRRETKSIVTIGVVINHQKCFFNHWSGFGKGFSEPDPGSDDGSS